MQNVYEKLISCYESIQEKIPFTPKVALVLGSGLGDYAEEIRVEAELDYHEIDGFPVSTVPGHAGKFIFKNLCCCSYTSYNLLKISWASSCFPISRNTSFIRK